MIVAVINKDYPFDIILRYSLFNKMNISIDTYTSRNGTHEVIPNIKINSVENRYHVGTIALADASKREKILKTLRISNINILDDIYIFSQE